MEIMEIYLLRWPENWRLRLKRAAMPWLFQGREITSEIGKKPVRVSEKVEIWHTSKSICAKKNTST